MHLILMFKSPSRVMPCTSEHPSIKDVYTVQTGESQIKSEIKSKRLVWSDAHPTRK